MLRNPRIKRTEAGARACGYIEVEKGSGEVRVPNDAFQSFMLRRGLFQGRLLT